MSESKISNQDIIRDDERFFTVAELWNLVWEHKMWYVLSLVIFLGAGSFYLYRTPEVYNRSAKVIIDESNHCSRSVNIFCVARPECPVMIA